MNDDEPTMTNWTESTYSEMLTMLRIAAPESTVVIGVDGRSGSGKSTFAANMAAEGADVAVVHTDDISWHESFFDWHHLLIDGVLAPLRHRGPPISYRPPAWNTHHRSGAIQIPGGTTVLLVEGVGACRHQLHTWFDATVWVQADADLAYRRVVARGNDPVDFIEEWTAEENPFLAADRPWDRATLFVCGEAASTTTGTVLHSPAVPTAPATR